MAFWNLICLAIAQNAAASETCQSLVQRAAHTHKIRSLDNDLRLNLHETAGLQDSVVIGGISFEAVPGFLRGLTNPSFAIIGEDVFGVFRWLSIKEYEPILVGPCADWYSKIAFSSMPLSKFRAKDPDWYYELTPDPRFQVEDKERNAECEVQKDHPPVGWGTEDPRLFSFSGEMYMSFVSTIKAPLNGSIRSKCPKETGYRVWTSKITVQPLSLAPAVQLYTDTMYSDEKAWILFPAEDKLLAVYSVYPHKLLDVNLSSGYAPQLAETHSPLLEDLAESIGISPEDFHGGAGVALVNTTQREPYFLSAVHYHTQTGEEYCSTETSFYWSYLYAFRAQYPFDIIAVAKTHLPLQIDNLSNKLGEEPHDTDKYPHWKNIAYITSMFIDNNDLIIGYGQADRDARIYRKNIQVVESALFD